MVHNDLLIIPKSDIYFNLVVPRWTLLDNRSPVPTICTASPESGVGRSRCRQFVARGAKKAGVQPMEKASEESSACTETGGRISQVWSYLLASSQY
jgi:hypothetical protein